MYVPQSDTIIFGYILFNLVTLSYSYLLLKELQTFDCGTKNLQVYKKNRLNNEKLQKFRFK